MVGYGAEMWGWREREKNREDAGKVSEVGVGGRKEYAGIW